MYFFYVDESGDRNPAARKDEPFVMLSLSMYEYQWKRFESTLNGRKRRLIQDIFERTGVRLDLADAEVHSVDVRIPKNRWHHPFLKHLSDDELTSLTDLYFQQLEQRHIGISAVVVDKACLDEFMDMDKLTKKVYELLLERGETFIGNNHPKQQAVFVLDNTTRELNRSIAMKHAYFQQTQTSAGVKLRHVIEMPFFVESYLSNGVQLADLCAYIVYRTFRANDATYPYLDRLLPYFYASDRTADHKIDGLKLFPDDNRWLGLLGEIQKKRVRLLTSENEP